MDEFLSGDRGSKGVVARAHCTKILLDEWLPSRGPRAAEGASYDVLLTVDTGVIYQQNPAGRKLAIIILRARSNECAALLPLLEPIREALKSMRPSDVRILAVED